LLIEAKDTYGYRGLEERKMLDKVESFAVGEEQRTRRRVGLSIQAVVIGLFVIWAIQLKRGAMLSFF
jgi:hypothetical protein